MHKTEINSDIPIICGKPTVPFLNLPALALHPFAPTPTVYYN